MKQPPQIHEFDPQIYPFKLWITITADLTAISEKFDDYPSGNEFEYKDSEKMIAFAQNVQQKSSGFIGAIIVFKSKKHCTVKNISHESTHVARILWDHVGEPETGREADAYLVGWIADCCEKVIKNKLPTPAQI